MPADKFNFAPSAAIFKPEQKVDYLSPNDKGVRTFGQMVGHIAQANYFFFSSVSGAKMGPEVKAFPVNHWDALTPAEVAEFSTLKTGLHANLAETSAILRINPDLVDMERANAVTAIVTTIAGERGIAADRQVLLRHRIRERRCNKTLLDGLRHVSAIDFNVAIDVGRNDFPGL